MTIRDLVRNALRMRPDRIIVGEVRGAEALDMLQAMNTGHEGSLSTVHANSPRDALSRIETMVLMAGFELPVRAIRQYLSSALDLIVQLERLDDGSRHVTSITEVHRMEADVITLQPLYEFKAEGVDEHGKIVGGLRPTAIRPLVLSKFDSRRIEVPGMAVRRNGRDSPSTARGSPDDPPTAHPRNPGRRTRSPGRGLHAGSARAHPGRALPLPGAWLRRRPPTGSTRYRSARGSERERKRDQRCEADSGCLRRHQLRNDPRRRRLRQHARRPLSCGDQRSTELPGAKEPEPADRRHHLQRIGQRPPTPDLERDISGRGARSIADTLVRNADL